MKLLEEEIKFEGNLPQDDRLTFKLKSNPKMFAILSDGIYTDKIMAVIRELSCNARDSAVMAAIADPDPARKFGFMVNVPTTLDNNFWVEDVGLGIDPDHIVDIFWTYGASTKTHTNDAIGALGLGSKSPFAYTKSSFLVINRYNGVEYKYFCFINEGGVPDGKLVFQAPTDLPNGVRVELAVRIDDIKAFRQRIIRFYSYWNPADLPTFQGDTSVVKAIEEARGNPISTGSDWNLRKYSHDNAGPVAVMGGVPYRITAQSLPRVSDRARAILNQPITITFPIGALSFQASREELSYDEPTCKVLSVAFDRIAGELVEKSKSDLHNMDSPNAFLKKFNEKYRLLYESFPFVAQIIMGETFKLADGREVVPSKLRTDRIHVSKGEHLLFNVQLISADYKIYVKGPQRFGLTAISFVMVEHPGTVDPKTKRTVGAQNNTIDWFSPALEPKPLLNVNMKRRAANYLHEGHKVTNTNFDLYTREGNIAFIINDLGERGSEGIRFYAEQFNDPDLIRAYQSAALYFIDGFGGGLSAADTLVKFSEHVKGTIADGAKVVLLSTLPKFKFPEPPKRDFVAAKKPAQKGTIEQRFDMYTFPVDQAGKHIQRELYKLDGLINLSFYKPTHSRDYARHELKRPMLYVPTVHGQPLGVHKQLIENELVGALFTLGLLEPFMTDGKPLMIGLLSDRQQEECKNKGVELVDMAELLKPIKDMVTADAGLLKAMQSRLNALDRSDGARIAKAFINESKFVKAMGPLGPNNVFVKLRGITNVVKSALIGNTKRSALVYVVHTIERQFDDMRTLLEGKVRLADVLKAYPLLEHLGDELYDRKEPFFHQVVAYLVGVDRTIAEAEAQARRDTEAAYWAEALLTA
jgi:hypothetical protein